MGEPIRLYDRDGLLHIMHSPTIARMMVESGQLFEQPPAVELTPDDTHHDMPAVTPRKPRRRDSGNSGVL